METYLVGGAVRDQLLGLPVRERDYVVVGTTEAEMRAAGFRSVGRDFPVFLHPETLEQYALARTERKTGPGHQGFVCHAAPDVTLEEDLGRRDLTINAIAMDRDGRLVDPFSGQQDLEDRVLRHVSDAFVEDPLRILRLARFLAYLSNSGFHVDPSTTELVSQMVSEGQLSELTPERVLLEMDKALVTESPADFFHYLSEIGASAHLWPEVSDTAVDRLTRLDSADRETRFATLLMDLNDTQIRNLCGRLKCTNQRRELSLLLATQLDRWAALNTMSAKDIVDFLYDLDALRRQERFEQFCKSADTVSGGRLAPRWFAIARRVRQVRARDLARDLTGPAAGRAVRRAQVQSIGDLLNDQ